MTTDTTTPRTLGDIVDDARRPIAAAYWEHVRDFAVEIHQNTPDPADPARADQAAEYAEWSEWTLTTRNAYLVFLCTDHRDAWADDGLSLDVVAGRVPGLDELVCSAAADAMTADIMEELARLADPDR